MLRPSAQITPGFIGNLTSLSHDYRHLSLWHDMAGHRRDDARCSFSCSGGICSALHKPEQTFVFRGTHLPAEDEIGKTASWPRKPSAHTGSHDSRSFIQRRRVHFPARTHLSRRFPKHWRLSAQKTARDRNRRRTEIVTTTSRRSKQLF